MIRTAARRLGLLLIVCALGACAATSPPPGTPGARTPRPQPPAAPAPPLSALRLSAPAVSAAAAAGLDVGVVDNGVRPADSPARELMLEVLAAMGPSERQRLAGYHIRLDIIPAGRELTDLSDFAFLAGRTTFDGRSYAALRAVGPTVHDQTVIYAVGAEEVVPGMDPAYGPGFAVAHETGHVVRHLALSPSEDATLRAIYAARRAAGGPWLTDYASSNDDEYFADSTAAWFGHPWSPGAADRFSRAWVEANDPQMAALLARVYAGG